MVNLVVLAHTVGAKLRRSSGTVWLFKVAQGHWNWHGSIGYLWLPVSVPSNCGSISYHFRDKGHCKIFTPRAFNAPAERIPLGIIDCGGAQKLEQCPYQTVKSATCIRLDTITDIGGTDGLTDGIAKTTSRSAYIACWRAKKRERKSVYLSILGLPYGVDFRFLGRYPDTKRNCSDNEWSGLSGHHSAFADTKLCCLMRRLGRESCLQSVYTACAGLELNQHQRKRKSDVIMIRNGLDETWYKAALSIMVQFWASWIESCCSL